MTTGGRNCERWRLLGLGALLMVAMPLAGEHLPDARTARGRPETTLAGIDIHRSQAASLIDRLGKPSTYRKFPETEEAAEMTWIAGGSALKATIDAGGVAYAVEASGPSIPRLRTGRGLVLGSSIADARRIYGRRFAMRSRVMDFEWEDGTELRLKLHGNKVLSILLLAAVE